MKVRAALALAVALTACTSDRQAAQAPSPSVVQSASGTPAPSATPSRSTTPEPTPTPTEAVTVFRMGQAVDMSAPEDFGAAGANVTVYRYRQPVATSGPQPHDAGQPRSFVWAAAEVKVCVGQSADRVATVGSGPWSLTYANSSSIDPSSTLYGNAPEPDYGFEETVARGKCRRGWITFAVPGKPRPVSVTYAPDIDGFVPRDWTIPR